MSEYLKEFLDRFADTWAEQHENEDHRLAETRLALAMLQRAAVVMKDTLTQMSHHLLVKEDYGQGFTVQLGKRGFDFAVPSVTFERHGNSRAICITFKNVPASVLASTDVDKVFALPISLNDFQAWSLNEMKNISVVLVKAGGKK